MNVSKINKADALIAFGANQGQREKAFEKAIHLLESNEDILEVLSSRPIETKAVLGDVPAHTKGEASEASGGYLNAAIRVLTTLSVDELHAVLIEIEASLGRQRQERWGPRTIDLDLLLFSDQKFRSPKLTVPHPRMTFRQFVLRPALEIAGDMVHPESGKSVAQLVDHLNQDNSLICFVSDDGEFAKSVVSNLAFHVEIIEDVNQFMKSAPNAKLVVSCFGLSDPSEMSAGHRSLERFATNFAGPMLQIDQSKGVEFARMELTAAFEAMSLHEPSFERKQEDPSSSDKQIR